MEFLLIFLFILALITAIGHGIWVVGAAIARAVFGADSGEATELRLHERHYTPPRQPTFCDHCGASLGANSKLCFSCGRTQLDAADKETLQDLDATERQFKRWREQGALDEVKFNWLDHLLAKERQRLTQPAPPPPAPQPVVAPETVPEPIAPIRIESPASPPIAEPQIARAETPHYESPFTAPQPAPNPQSNSTRVVDRNPQSPAPRKSFAEMLAAFMEEKNIRWGELLGGLLIIGCSLALVISLWSQIEQIPLLKFFIFTAMTGAFAGLGFYSEHRWKLPNTSRGLLITATMLVPLNFLAIAAFAKDISASNPLVIGSEIISLALFLWMALRAGKVITPGWQNWLTIGVVGTSATQLILRRLAEVETATLGLWFLAALPIACYAIATFGMLRELRTRESLEIKRANQAFTLLSASSFASLVALGLLLFKTQDFVFTLQRIAPMISLLAIPALFAGIVIWQRVRNIEPQHLSLTSASIAVFSAIVMLASLVFAWPFAANVMIVAALNFAALTAIALLFRLPVAHLLALPCLVLAYLLGVHLALGRGENDSLSLFTALVSVTSGKALAMLFVLLLLACEMLYKRERKDDGFYYALLTAAVGALSLLLVSIHGFGRVGDPQQVAWVYALFAASAFWYGTGSSSDPVTVRARSLPLLYLGWGLTFLAFVQFLHFGFSRSFKLTMLLFATVALAAAIALRRTKQFFAEPSQRVALTAAIVAGAVLLLTAPMNTAFVLCGQTLWLAGLIVALAWLYRSPALFTAFQAITYATVFLAVTATLHGTNLLATLPIGLRSLRPQMLALALLSPAWIVLRLLLRRFGITREEAVLQDLPKAWQNTASRLLYPEWPTCDQAVTWALIACFVALSLFGVVPGLSAEIAPTMNVAMQAINLSLATEWLLLTALLLVLTISLWEQFTQWRVLGILLLLALICLLLAQTSVAAASTWRWTAAAYLLATASAIWWRERLYTWASALRFPLINSESTQLTSYARALTMLLAAAPIIGLTLWAADLQIGNGGFRVPGASFFANIGAVAAYLVPLVVLSIVLIGHALRERVSSYAFAGGFVLNFAAMLAYLNGLSAMTETTWVRLVQINAITSAVFALLWLGWQQRQPTSQVIDWLLKLQVLIGAALSFIVIAIAGAGIFFNPEFPGAGRIAVGSVWGWLALVLAGCGVAWLRRLQRAPLSLMNLAIGLSAVGVLLACTVSRWDTGNWLGYHTMLVASLAITASMLAAGFRKQPQAITLTNVYGAITLVLASCTLGSDPQNPWWAVATFAALSLLAMAAAQMARVPGYLYVAGGLLNAAVTAWWFFTRGTNELLTINVLTLALGGLVLFAFARQALREVKGNLPPYHHVAAVVSLLVISLLVANGLLRDFLGEPLHFNAFIRWATLAATTALMVASLWDATARFAVGGLYVLGLVMAGLAIDQADFSGRRLLFALTMSAAGYAILTSWMWAERQRLTQWAAQFGIPQHASSNSLESVNAMLIAFLLTIGGLISTPNEPFKMRFFVAIAIALQAVSFALLARGSARQWGLRVAALGVGLIGVVLVGWAFLPAAYPVVNRAVILLLVALSAAEVIGLWFVKRFTNDWTRAAKSLLYPLCGIVAVCLGGLLLNDIAQQLLSGHVALPMFAILSVVATLFGLSMQAIYFAVRAERDPLQLSERGRMAYVYVSEALLALTFLHIRLTMPWLFTGFFTRYWPFVVMVLAFVGVGLGELFRRRGQRVLGEPLLNTGFFLPIFPVIGFWLVASKVDYSGLLLLVGALYAIVAVLRSSFGVSLLACLAANGALWYFLSQQQHFSLLERPQLWLTPAAISVLIAAYLNRERLTVTQMTNLRYITLSVIYVSSTAEIFVRGVAESPWQPMALMALSAAGVLAGMLLRVRAFLYLGSSFLLLSIFTMIWHAAANFGWTWLWYVTGIVVGLAIILLFAMFEKKRAELLRLVEGLRAWEA
jgi:hypothetical protein